MKKSEKVRAVCFALGVLAYGCNGILPAAIAAQHTDIPSTVVNNSLVASPASKFNTIKSVTSLAQVYGDGEKVAAAAVEYPSELDAASLSPDDFLVAGKKITTVYTNDKPVYTEKNVPGRYAILSFAYVNSTSDKAMQAQPNNGNNGPNGTDAPHYSSRKAPDLSIEVAQIGNIATLDGAVYLPTRIPVKNTAQSDASIAGFKQYEYTDPKTGYTIPYNLYLPKDYNPNKKYPLLFFVADASANSNDVKMTLVQGNGATVWATPSEQAKHECIILAPEYTTSLIDSLGMLTDDSNTWTKGLTLVSDLLFDVMDRYSVDTDRVYGTGQSQGGMTNIAISDKYPDLFAAQYLVACQWNVDEMETMKDKNLWIVVCEGDTKAYPGMNAATKRWEELGTKVARSDMWNSKSTAAEFTSLVKQTKAHNAKINYTVFQGGNHNYTWSFAYNIEGIRDWLFAQTKPGKSVASSQDAESASQHPPRSELRRSVLMTGINYYQGNGVEKDYSRALKYFHLADQHGDFKAARYIGLCYENGYGVSKDYAIAVKWYQKAADNGDITGTYYLGHMYEAGLGIVRNYDKARQLYQKSAERGDVIAAPGMVAVGRLYENGLGVNKNIQEAKKWYQKALNAGYKDAATDLARVQIPTEK